jgi:hypothetical protein
MLHQLLGARATAGACNSRACSSPETRRLRRRAVGARLDQRQARRQRRTAGHHIGPVLEIVVQVIDLRFDAVRSCTQNLSGLAWQQFIPYSSRSEMGYRKREPLAKWYST